jgi:poly(A) polymerase
VREKRENTPDEEMRPEPLIKGHDLIALGLKPGPAFKDILSAAEDAQLEGSIHTREEGLAFVQQLLLSNPEVAG